MRLLADVGVRATAVLERDHLAVARRRVVGTDTEERREWAGEPDHEPAGRAMSGRGQRYRRLGPVVAGQPALRRKIATGDGEHPLATDADLADDLADLARGRLIERLVADQVTGNQPDVLLLDRHEVAGTEVALLHAVFPGDPPRRLEGVVAGQKHYLVHRHGLLPRRARHRHAPLPADVARLPRLEQVR